MSLPQFHPTIQRWFGLRFGEPTEPQREGWPHIRGGNHTLISAPTGTGKTLAAYLSAIDSLARQGPQLADETAVLYVSPLRALSNDVQKNLQGPLAELTALDPELPEIRVLVRTGDTPGRERAAMRRKPPHILVTTPESLYILLTSRGGREMLATVRTVIVDEIHALARDKRGSHLALSLERLEALTGPIQRIGLSATQKPLSEVAQFLVGVGRDCELVDVGHRRPMDVAIEVPPSPLSTVCSHEQWDEIYTRVSELILAHKTTLVFVNTRKLAERVAARLTGVLGEELVTCHHSSLSRERRLDAESRLKAGSLRALVATASLELGIDIGDVDLVIQIGATRSIATFLQRVGRSGHAVRGMPKGRLFPLTTDELVEAAALLRSAKRGELDRTPQPRAPLDILAQQVVASCVAAGEQGWFEDELFELCRRAWPYRELARSDFDAVLEMHAQGRRGLLHRDGVGRRVMARKRARITAITGGGAIPDVADFRVLQDPEGTFVGTLNEDFAVEANVGDIFQLGNTSWRILKVERGTVRVADAQGQPPSIPFWLGEGASRTPELSAAIGNVRDECGDPRALEDEIGLAPEAATQIAEYLNDGLRVLGAVPTQRRVVLERFFDESGGMQLVLHAPFGGRINRAWGLALRKRFCRGFGFELQAAANEEAIVISLGLQHSFPLAEVFDYLHPNTVEKLLTQAILDQPMFESRWRWNATRSLVLARYQNGKPVPPAILRMRAGDLLAAAFPAAVACPETMPPGDLPIPMEHPLVRQTIDDCLTEATDVAGLIEVLRGLRDGSIERVAIDTAEPSSFARGILNSEPYTFLDDAPLEERRTQAVLTRRALDERSLDGLGALDPAAVERVRDEAWPLPETAEEVHDALLWMGYITDEEASEWREWLGLLADQGRVTFHDGRWFAVDGLTEAKQILLGRLEALGPVAEDDPRIAVVQVVRASPDVVVRGSPDAAHLLTEGLPAAPVEGKSPNRAHSATADLPESNGDLRSEQWHGQETVPQPGHETVPQRVPTSLLAELERDGAILRTRLDGRTMWCERRLLARIHRYTLDRLRREIEPVTASEFLQFLACWQHVDEEFRLEGPRGVAEVLGQLAGFEIPAKAWENHVLARRVRDYRREWLDELTLSGEFAWGRLWGAGASAIRVTPLSFVPHDDLDTWLVLTEQSGADDLSGPADDVLHALSTRGAMFTQHLAKAADLPQAYVDRGLAELVAHGMVTCDSFASLRQLITPPSRRRRAPRSVGRWSCFRSAAAVERRSPDLSVMRGSPDPAQSATEALPITGNGDHRSDKRQGQATQPQRRSTWPHDRKTVPQQAHELLARQLLRRTGVVFRRTLLRERLPITWTNLVRIYRRMELRGEVRGGRFVAGFSGEQFALPEAVELLRRLRREGPRAAATVTSADPLNFQGILTPEPRISPSIRQEVLVG